jgi:hypothetical protein
MRMLAILAKHAYSPQAKRTQQISCFQQYQCHASCRRSNSCYSTMAEERVVLQPLPTHRQLASVNRTLRNTIHGVDDLAFIHVDPTRVSFHCCWWNICCSGAGAVVQLAGGPVVRPALGL